MSNSIIYEERFMGIGVKVFSDRIEMEQFGTLTRIPISQISSVDLPWGLGQVVIETSGGKKYKLSTFKKKEIADAIYQAQTGLNTKS